MSRLSFLTPLQNDGLIAVAIILASGALAAALQRGLFLLLKKRAAGHTDGILAAVVRRTNAPTQFIFPLIAIAIVALSVRLPDWLKDPIEAALSLAITAAIAWAVIALIGLTADVAKSRYRLEEEDNLLARQAETRLDILNRVATTLVVLIAVALMLMTFPPIRTIGATLLASAGAAGLIVGLAARPFFANLVAGVQIALTQPIRIDDVVVVESEQGRIEKITQTYVVVRLWDLRRMVLPLTYFLEKPFQNWTYSSANLIGSVLLYLGYDAPMDAIREETERILKTTTLWDGNVCSVAMTDAKESFVEVRVLVSARNAAQLLDLRSLVRERLIAFIASQHPQTLPNAVAAKDSAGAG